MGDIELSDEEGRDDEDLDDEEGSGTAGVDRVPTPAPRS
jgi:hypothetical protein